MFNATTQMVWNCIVWNGKANMYGYNITKFSPFISKSAKNEFENHLKQFTKLLLLII